MRPLTNRCIRVLACWVRQPASRVDIDQDLLQLLRFLKTGEVSAPPAKPVPFHYQDSRAYREIHKRWGSNLNLPDLVAMADSLAKLLPSRPRIGRDAKRRKDLLYEWLEQHIEELLPLLTEVVFLNSDGTSVRPPGPE